MEIHPKNNNDNNNNEFILRTAILRSLQSKIMLSIQTKLIWFHLLDHIPNPTPETNASHLSQLLFAWFAIQTKIIWFLSLDHISNPSPEMNASHLSQLFFAWFDGVIKRGWKNPITEKDLYDINPDSACRNVMQDWSNHWQKQAKRKVPKNKTLSIVPTLLMTFIGPFARAASNRVVSIILQQVIERFTFITKIFITKNPLNRVKCER